MNTKEKLTLTALALFAYLIPFSAKINLGRMEIVGTNVVNDFTTVFLFGADILVLAISLVLFILYFKDWAQNKLAIFFYALFVIWAAISLFAGNATPLGLAMLVRLILVYLLLRAILKTPSEFVWTGLSLGLIIGGVVQSIMAFSQFAMQKSMGLFFAGESPLIVGEPGVATFTLFGQKLLRAYGTLPHPNILAFYLCVALLACLVALYARPHLNKFLIPAGIIISVGLLLTFSRLFITLLALVLISGYFLLKQHTSKKFFALGAAVLLAVALIFSIRPPGQDQSFDLRQAYSTVYNEQSKERPLRGVGIGQSVYYSGEIVQKTFGDSYEAWMHQPVHNTYALMRTETGWLGLILFFFFLILATDKVIKRLKENPQNHALVFGAAAMAVILAGMFFEHLFFTNPNSLYLSFAIVGLFASAKDSDGT